MTQGPWTMIRLPDTGWRLTGNGRRFVADVPNESDARLIAEAPALLALARYAFERGEGDAEMAGEILARIEGEPRNETASDGDKQKEHDGDRS